MSPTIQDITIKVTPVLKSNSVEFAGLFGSFARGEATPTSDIDLLVGFSVPVGLFELVHLERELSGALGKKVDLVTEGALNRYIKPRILNDLKVIYGEQR